jgi:hypothetical protein
MKTERRTKKHTDEPVTLHRTIQAVIGEALREHYKPQQKLSHELFVLLMHLQERERREAASAALRRIRATRSRCRL